MKKPQASTVAGIISLASLFGLHLNPDIFSLASQILIGVVSLWEIFRDERRTF